MARLAAEPQRFTFDAVVRLLTFHRRRADPVDAARFTSVAGSSYPGAEVTGRAGRWRKSPPRVTVGLIGLTGPVGVLPRHYSDAVVADQRSRSFSLTDFLDLISHRMIAAFAAAGAKYRPHRAADVGVLTPGRQRADPVAEVLLALTGYATPRLAERLRAGAAPLRHYAGFFSAHPRSADRLEALASDWLGRPVKVEQFAGAWLALPLDQRTRLPVGVSPVRSANWASMRRRACAPGTSRRESCCASGRSILPISNGSCRTDRCCATWSRWCGPLSASKWASPSIPCWPATLSRRSAALSGEPGAAGSEASAGLEHLAADIAVTPRRTDAADAFSRRDC